jgi:hypothetical protein
LKEGEGKLFADTGIVTDDLEIKAEGQTLVKLKPRSPFTRNGSRWPWVKGGCLRTSSHWDIERHRSNTQSAHLQSGRGSEPAGLDIHGKPVEVDIDSEYDSYKTFEIEFENSPSKHHSFSIVPAVLGLIQADRPRRLHTQMERGYPGTQGAA